VRLFRLERNLACLGTSVDRQGDRLIEQARAGRRLQVRLGATQIQVLDPGAHGKVVATHVRSLHKGSEDLQLDHYLEVLTRNLGRWPEPPRWSRPAPVGRSPPPINGSGTPPDALTATVPAPGRWSGCCCCTAP
jgi:hypothetical protein